MKLVYPWQDVADKFNIAKYVLYTSPSSTLALMAYVPTLQKQGRLPVATEPFNDIPGVQPTVATDMPTMMLNYKEIPDVYDFFLRNCDRLPDAAGVLINTFEELEHKIIEGVRSRIYGKLSAKVSIFNIKVTSVRLASARVHTLTLLLLLSFILLQTVSC